MTSTSSIQGLPAVQIPADMQRAVVEPSLGVRLETIPVPTPGPGQLLVQSTLVGICGTDTHALAGHHPFLDREYAPGHEATGVVVARGDGTGRLSLGQRVLLKPNVACGTCVNCRGGRTNACENLVWIGCDPTRQWSGAMAEYFLAPESNLYAVPDEMDDPTATLVECLATPVHAARIAGDLAGARVVVLGAGTIGVLSVIAALEAGASAVAVTDMEQSKIDRAVRVGARGGVLAGESGLEDSARRILDGPVDVVFDCVANGRSLEQGIGLLRRAGTLLILGVPPRPATLNLPIIQDWELRVQGCAGYTETDIETSIQIAASGGLPADEIKSGTYSLAEAAMAIERASADSSGKVFVGLR